MTDSCTVKADSSAAPGHADYSEDILIDIKQLTYLKETMGSEFVVEIANLFIVEATNSMDEMLDAFEHDSYEQIASNSHTGKSGAATLGCTNLAEQFESIENAVRAEQPAYLGPMIARLQILIKDSQRALLHHVETL